MVTTSIEEIRERLISLRGEKTQLPPLNGMDKGNSDEFILFVVERIDGVAHKVDNLRGEMNSRLHSIETRLVQHDTEKAAYDLVGRQNKMDERLKTLEDDRAKREGIEKVSASHEERIKILEGDRTQRSGASKMLIFLGVLAGGLLAAIESLIVVLVALKYIK